MYRQPFGDAFLLTFAMTSEPHHILIDCGVLPGVPNAQKWGRDIVRDVALTTSSHLDVVVATHMRQDHASAYGDAADAFSRFAVDEVWLPWPEDPADALAARHQRLRRRQLEAVRQARALLDTSRDAGSPMREPAETTLERMLAFYGPDSDGTEKLDAARNTLFGFGRAPRFLEQGTRIALPQLPDLRVHVLGPARDEGLLGFDSYGRDRGFYGALLARADMTRDDGGEIEMTQPFDVRQRWTTEWHRGNPLIRGAIESYDDPDAHWRRIDDDWLFYGAEIAHRLYEGRNNLSLALAFELTGSSEVLLFPGDARVSDQNLLARTVFFKVPNHGGHSSLDIALLEAMNHPDLVAAITADAEFARSLGLDMPAAVEARLLEKTQGRLLRPQPDVLTGTATSASPSTRSFAERTSVTDLYVDFHIL